MSIYKQKVTVFTPTYNRAYILEKCYKSLVSQTSKNFIWLIVDDGSTDKTEQLVGNWINESKIKIRYIKQKNSGKHIAHNTGVLSCDTEIFVCVDSDDYLTPNAIEIICKHWHLASATDLAGIIALRGGTNHQALGTRMPSNITKVSIFDLYDKFKFKGDTVIFFKTQDIKQYLFPHFEGEKFVTESVIYDQISREKKMLLMDQVLYICEYLEDGYTNNISEIHKKNPEGYILYLKQRIIFADKYKEKLKWTSYFIAGLWSIKTSPNKYYELNKCMLYLAYPRACIIYIKPKIKDILISIKKRAKR